MSVPYYPIPSLHLHYLYLVLLRRDHPFSPHVVDQYYYHALSDTSERDCNQTISRYQSDMGLKPRVLTAVDQLWLWVLAGVDGVTDTVLACFPPQDMFALPSPGPNFDPDPRRLTDPLTIIRRHLMEDISSIKKPHELAGLIASQCSRAYLHAQIKLRKADSPADHTPSTPPLKTLNFLDIYETAIAKVVSS